jgi:hypothetical protein
MPTIIIQPSSKDTALESGYPTSNRGRDPKLWIGRYYIGSSGKSVYRALIQFDLGILPPDSLIVEAILKLYINYATNDCIPAYVTPFLIIDEWDENTATWNNAPNIDETVFGSTKAITSKGWYGWNITNIAKGWINGLYANNGVMLRTPEIQNLETKSFYSKDESINVSLRPILQLTYITGTPFTLNDRRFVKTKSFYVSRDEESYTDINDCSSYSKFTYFVYNTSENPVIIKLLISPGDDVWIEDSGEIVLAPGKTATLVPYFFSQYTKLSFKNKEIGKAANITVWFEAQV